MNKSSCIHYRFRKVARRCTLITFFTCFGFLFLPGLQAQVKTDVKANVSGSINCLNKMVTLVGNSDSPNARFSWTGPSGFKATSRNAVAIAPGEYTLKVVAQTGIATATVKVIVDTIPPEETMAKVSGLLTCADTFVILSGSSTTPGVTYQWKGAREYRAADQKISVTFPGLFLLTVINPANGCKSFAEAEVQKNVIPPAGVTASALGVLTCKSPFVKLTGTSVTPGVTYNWTGPDFTSSLPKPSVAVAGKYTLTVTNPANGCSSEANVIAEQNIKEPEVTAITPDTLTCKTHKVLLKVSSNTSGTEFNWSGPGSFGSSMQTTTVSIPGNYTVIVTDPVNGCITKKMLTVMPDTIGPTVSFSVSGSLTCEVKSVKISSTPSSSAFSYTWNGPDNFSSGLDNPEVTKPGSYHVKVIKRTSGCFSKANVTVSGEKCSK